ncbi:MAG: serine hydrolase [Blastocatellia bacterium]
MDRVALVGTHDESKLAEAVGRIRILCSFLSRAMCFRIRIRRGHWRAICPKKLAGESYSKADGESRLKPLGMNHTTIHPTIAMTYPISVGQMGDPDKPAQVMRPIEDNTRDWPAGFLFSNSADLARFAMAFMNGGRIDGKQALSEKIVAQMMTRFVPVHSQLEDGSYGYGLMMMKQRGVELIEHGGTMVGFASDFGGWLRRSMLR